MGSVSEKEASELTVTECGFLLAPDFDKFSVDEAEYGSSFDLFFSPFPRCPHYRLAPNLETASGFEEGSGALFHLLVIRVSCPMHVLFYVRIQSYIIIGIIP